MFVNIDGDRVHTAVHGDGPVTLLGLAGVFGNVELWQQPFELLHHDHRTIAFDHLGTGETRVPPERVTFEGQVELVGGVMDQFGVDRCVLLGESSLSAVAVAAAHRWPDRVDGLALVAGRVDHAPDDRTRGFVHGLRTAFEEVLPVFVEMCLPEDEHGHLRSWLHDIIARTGSERSAHLVESFYDVDIAPLLPEVTVPTLVLHGADDVINPPAAARELVDRLPDAELVLFDDCGHVPTLSRPRDMADAIAAFISERVGR